MTTELTPIRNAVRSVLETIPGLRVLDYTPDTWNDFPLSIITFAHVRISPTLAGSKLAGEIKVTLMTGGPNLPESLTDLDPLIESVHTAISADPKLAGAVHYIVPDRLENIGVRRVGSRSHAAADLHLRFMAG